MPDYCTLADALSQLPNIGTLRDAATGPPAVTATQPSATQAAALLAAVTSEIDRKLRGQGATTPATGPKALAALKPICMDGTAARIALAKWPNASGPGAAPAAAEVCRANYLRGLDDIDAGRLTLDAPPDASTTFAHGFGDGTEEAVIPY